MAGRYERGWSAVHQQVFKLRMIDGLAPREIAEKSGIPISRIRDILRTKKFIEHEDSTVGSAVEKARKLLENKLLRAVNKIVHIMDNGKPADRLRFDAAKEILYQCGMKPVEVIENRGRDYTPEELQSSLLVIKEVKEIEEKLSTQGSGFLLKRDAETPLSAPVTTDVTTQENNVETGTIETTSSVGQETVPAESVLPV
jgi:hypothetical protein